jgi:tetratricopeptide (TPR) repeat protein
MQRAIDAGRRGQPDVRHRIAEFHLRAGRLEQGVALYERLRAEAPEDVWIYNAGGFDFLDAGDHERALDWLTTGLRLAIAAGDPEGLVGQLAEQRRRCLALLGRVDEESDGPCDELDAEAERVLRARVRDQQRQERAAVAARSPNMLLALAWFPPAELAQARERWPELTEGFGADDDEHRRNVEAALRQYRDAGAPRLAVAPLDVSGLLNDAGRRGLDPGSAEARSTYSAEVARLGRALPWPPPRNGPCWCGSGAKYKKCCNRR